MKNFTKRKLRACAKLGIATIPFTVAMRIIDGGFIPGAIVLGLGLGFSVGMIEFFVPASFFKRLPFGVHILTKSLLLIVLMGVSYCILNLIDLIAYDNSWEYYTKTTFNVGTLLGLFKMLGLFSFLLFFVHLDRLLGPGVILNYVIGRYHQPLKESRIFMFIDLKGSTTLADHMSGENYFSFLQDYFSEMTEAILEADAQVYQYVGDEIVLTWPWERGLTDNNCIKVFYLIEDRLSLRKDYFLKKYGTFPQFKAGLHGGEVITAEIGNVKREIVYNGDVLNTTARIQSKCNELEQSLLTSSFMVTALKKDKHYKYESLGMFELKGKNEASHLYAVMKSAYTQ